MSGRRGHHKGAHTLVKEVAAQIARDAGLHAVKEKQLHRHPELIHADLFLQSLEPRPVALDFALWTREGNMAECQEEGWQYRVWAADLWGGMHPEARATTQKLIKALQRAGRFEDDDTVATMVWRAVTTAVLLRAASHIARHKKPVSG